MLGVARMMSNESPFAPSERVIAGRSSTRPPTGNATRATRALREKLAARNGVQPDGVILGAGATEMIDLVIRTFVAPGEEVLINVPTFSMYEARTRVVGGIPVLVPMTADGFDVPAILRAVTERTKVLFLCTPNNPTGSNLDEATIRRLLALGLPTVLDEAYYEFSGQDPYHRAETLARLCAEFPNAIVLRTFSKAFGLAGFRLGYSLSHPAVARLMARAKLPWNVSIITLAAAQAALEDEAEQTQRLATVRRGRSWLERRARHRGRGPRGPRRGELRPLRRGRHRSDQRRGRLQGHAGRAGVMVRSLVIHHIGTAGISASRSARPRRTPAASTPSARSSAHACPTPTTARSAGSPRSRRTRSEATRSELRANVTEAPSSPRKRASLRSGYAPTSFLSVATKSAGGGRTKRSGAAVTGWSKPSTSACSIMRGAWSSVRPARRWSRV